MPTNTSVNNWGTAQFIVDVNPAVGTHTTIQSAINDAASGDTIFVRDGTYAEALTGKAGVVLSAYGQNAILNGTITYTDNGTFIVSGMQIQNSAGNTVSTTGANNSDLQFFDCDFDVVSVGFDIGNNFSNVLVSRCQVVNSGANPLFNVTTGTLLFQYSSLSCTAGGVQADSTASGGIVKLEYCDTETPITTTATSTLNIAFCRFNPFENFDQTMLTIGGAGGAHAFDSFFDVPTALPMSVGSSLQLLRCSIFTTNTSAVSGAGVLLYDPISFLGSGIQLNINTVPIVMGQDQELVGNTPSSPIRSTVTNQDTTSNTSQAFFSSVTGNGSTDAGDSSFISQAGSDGGAALFSWGSGTRGFDGYWHLEGNFTGTFTGTGPIIAKGPASHVGFQYGITFDGINTLDSYSTNTFLPNLEFGGSNAGITYATQLGKYWTVGDIIHFAINVVLTSKGVSAGVATISNMPFAADNDGITQVFTMSGTNITYSVGNSQLLASLPQSVITLALQQQGIATSVNSLSDTNFANNSAFNITGFYWIN